jgi:hypothetical protein
MSCRIAARALLRTPVQSTARFSAKARQVHIDTSHIKSIGVQHTSTALATGTFKYVLLFFLNNCGMLFTADDSRANDRHVRAEDGGVVDADLSVPEFLGGPPHGSEPQKIDPEALFASALSACHTW